MKVIYPKLALIDLDGTLAGSLNILREAFVEISKECNFEFSEEEFQSFNGPSINQISQMLVEKHNLPIDLNLLVDKYQAILSRIYLNAPITNGAESFIKNLKLHGSKIGVVTSNSRFLATAWLEKKNLLHYFDFVVTSDDVTRTKPDPEPYILALKIANEDSIFAIAIEDSDKGVESAVSAGILTFALNSNYIKTQNSKVINVCTFEQILLNL